MIRYKRFSDKPIWDSWSLYYVPWKAGSNQQPVRSPKNLQRTFLGSLLPLLSSFSEYQLMQKIGDSIVLGQSFRAIPWPLHDPLPRRGFDFLGPRERSRSASIPRFSLCSSYGKNHGNYPTWLWLTVRHGIDGPNRNRWWTTGFTILNSMVDLSIANC
jgi:hypothetical protein